MVNRNTEKRGTNGWRQWAPFVGILAWVGLGLFLPDPTVRAVDTPSGKAPVSVALPSASAKASLGKSVPAQSANGTPDRTVKPKTAKSEAKAAKPEKVSTPDATVPRNAATPAAAPLQGPKVYPITSVFVKEELPEEKTLPPPPPPAPLDLGVAPEVQLFPEWARSATSATQSQPFPSGAVADARVSTQTAVAKTPEPAPAGPPEPQDPEGAAPGQSSGVKAVSAPASVPSKADFVLAASETTGTLNSTPLATQPAQIAAAAPTAVVVPKSGPATAKALTAKNGQKGSGVKVSPFPTPSIKPPSPTAPTKENPLDLNTATRAQLMELPGVDGIRADLILAHRRAIGSFRAATQLREVYGISDTIWEQVADLVIAVPGATSKPGRAASASRLPLDKVLKPALPQSPVRPKLPTPPAHPVAPAGTAYPDLSTRPSATPLAGK